MATASTVAAAATTAPPTDIWGQLEKKKVAGIGGSIPGAGIYLQQQAQAEQAFQNAKAQLEAQKNRSFQQFGLLPTGAVDPYSQYGQYQKMLHDQAVDYNTADEQALQRGLGGGPGLGMQGESLVKYGAGVQNTDFLRQAADVQSTLSQGAQDALFQRNAAFLSAQQAAIQNADAQKAAAAQLAAINAQASAAGGGGGGGDSGIPGLNMSDFRYGATIPAGYSDEAIYNAAAANAPAGATPMHIMNQGMVQNGMISIKYKMPDGTTNTIWIPLPQPDSAPQQSAPAPAPTPIPPPNPNPPKTPAAVASMNVTPDPNWMRRVGKLSRVLAL